MAEPSNRRLVRRIRNLARILRGEKAVSAAAYEAIRILLSASRGQLERSDMDPVVLDARTGEWRDAVTGEVLPPIETVFREAFAATAAGYVIDADLYATRHLEAVWNRLVGVSDEVFDVMRAALEEGRQAGEGIPQLADRVDALLADDQRWRNRAETIARTEVISANNGGAHDSAGAIAATLGIPGGQVVKEWMATHDHRTRVTHQDADGQQVYGMNGLFSVGAASLLYPGQPGGPAGEVINCRCTPLYLMPGDPGYPAAVTVPALVAAAEEDPVTDTAPEQDPAPLEEPTHAGVAVQAADTGRVLMIQRQMDETDPPEVRCTWEFPGGGIEDGETPEAAAWREFSEETGLPQPAGETTGGWRSPDGIYQAFVFTTPTEADAFPEGLNPDHEAAVLENPDDPGRRTPDVQAWFSREHIEEMGAAIRPEVRESTDWSQFGATVTEEGDVERANDEETAAVVEIGLTAAAAVDIVRAAVDDTPVDVLVTNQHVSEFMAHIEAAFAAAQDANTPPADPEAPEDVPAPENDTSEPVDPPEEETGGKFYGILAPEDVVSGDGRSFAAESMTSRTLPIPLMAQDAQDDGHDGAVRVGMVTDIWRDTETYATPMIRYSGDWDVSDNAREAQRQVDAGVARGVSVDGTDVTSRLVGSDGAEIDPMGETPADGVVIQVADEVKAAGLTICSVPAFEQAYIANGVLADRVDPEPGQGPEQPLPDAPADAAPVEEDPDALVAAAPAWTIGLTAAALGEGSWVVPAAHFTDPGLEAPTALTVTPEGRVYGHLATWGQCHLGGAAGQRGDQVRAAGKCMEVPTSASNYAYFGTGVVYTDDGGTVNVGSLTMDTGHANLRYGAMDAMAHYDNTGSVVADVVVGHDAYGIWFSGHLRPTATEAQVYALTASGSVSGDWREIVRGSRQLELVAALVVNVPGFPIGRPAVTAAAGGPVALVASGVITPDTHPVEPGPAIGNVTVNVTADHTALVASITAEVMSSIARQKRANAASARVRSHRVAALTARLNRSA